MSYIIITLLICLLGSVTFLPVTQAFIKRYHTGVNFFLTLAATLVGVLLAIAASNYEQEQQEKENLIKQLDATKAQIELVQTFSEKLLENAKNLPSTELTTYWVNNPLPYPEFLTTFVAQSHTVKHLSKNTLNEVNEFAINAKKVMLFRQEMYIDLLQDLRKDIDQEIKYQRGEISEAQL
ncbi:hypothetical protein [Pseudoalteromonas xiamenensis]|uniref:Uncharacterized protein n=1 Tax=Pseudoalteromonas xiamenensis TaxID=882626 RepID=A0A975DH81_9GAMM|nr:hypothetical protein [Pseudoalteromonas xiamenensis]QTH71150.1 hypothetical protein J5O05_15250 [Pseudoalteromonas xiamenensis]